VGGSVPEILTIDEAENGGADVVIIEVPARPIAWRVLAGVSRYPQVSALLLVVALAAVQVGQLGVWLIEHLSDGVPPPPPG
jgi:hypothetical protein